MAMVVKYFVGTFIVSSSMLLTHIICDTQSRKLAAQTVSNFVHAKASLNPFHKYPGLTCGFYIVKPRFLFETVDLWSYIMPIARYLHTLSLTHSPLHSMEITASTVSSDRHYVGP